jgi:uncharacterized membrane protein
VFGVLWAFPGILDSFDPTPVALYLVVGFALAAALLVSGLLYGPDAEAGRIDAVSSGAVAAWLCAAAILVVARDHDPLALSAFTLLAVATVAIAWRTESAIVAVPIAGALAALVIADWAVEIQWATLTVPGGPAVAPDPSRVLYGQHLALGFFYAALFAAAGFLAQGRSSRAQPPILWAATAVVTPLAILAALYWHIYGFERALPFAALALLIAALFAVATELLARRDPRPGLPSAAAIFATGSIAALALALTLALEQGWLTVALALMVPGTAWVERARPLPWLRTLCAILAGLVVLRIGAEPRIVADVGTTPIFNWILTVAAVTAVVLALAYLSLQVARFYQGPRLAMAPISGAEAYTYSVVWLAFGVLLLVIGVVLRSQPVRLCSAAVVIATVVQVVFLLYTADLTGLWRALAVIGLGLVLVGIGYMYQRLLFVKQRPQAPPPAVETRPI